MESRSSARAASEVSAPPGGKPRALASAAKRVKCRRAALAAARARKAAQERRRAAETEKNAAKERRTPCLVSSLEKLRKTWSQTGPCVAEFLAGESGGARKTGRNRTACWKDWRQLRHVAKLLLDPLDSVCGTESARGCQGRPEAKAHGSGDGFREKSCRMELPEEDRRQRKRERETTPSSIRDAWEEAAVQIGVWKLRDRRLPVPVETTAVLLDVLLRDPFLSSSADVFGSSPLSSPESSDATATRRSRAFVYGPTLRLAYAMSLVRVVNRLVDAVGPRSVTRSVAAVAAELGLHQELVQMRHDATHQNLPALSLLREGALTALDHLLRLWWTPQLERLDCLLGPPGGRGEAAGRVSVHLVSSWLTTAASLVRASRPLPALVRRANAAAQTRAPSLKAAVESGLAKQALNPLAEAAAQAALRGVQTPADMAQELAQSLQQAIARFADASPREDRSKDGSQESNLGRSSPETASFPPPLSPTPPASDPVQRGDAASAACAAAEVSLAADRPVGASAGESDSEELCSEGDAEPAAPTRAPSRKRARENQSETDWHKLPKRHETELLEWAIEDGGIGRAGWGVRTLLQQQVFEADVDEEVAISFCVEGLMASFDAASYPVLQIFFLQLLPLLSPAFAVDCLSRLFLLLLHADPLWFDVVSQETASCGLSSRSFPSSFSLSPELSPTEKPTTTQTPENRPRAHPPRTVPPPSLSPSSSCVPASCSEAISSSASPSSDSPSCSRGPLRPPPPRAGCGERGPVSRVSSRPEGEVLFRAQAAARRAQLWRQLLRHDTQDKSTTQGRRETQAEASAVREKGNAEDSLDVFTAACGSHSGKYCRGKEDGSALRCPQCMYTSMGRNLLSWLPLFTGTFTQPFSLPRLPSISGDDADLRGNAASDEEKQIDGDDSEAGKDDSEGNEGRAEDVLGSLTTGVSSLGVMAVLHHYAHHHFLLEEEETSLPNGKEQHGHLLLSDCAVSACVPQPGQRARSVGDRDQQEDGASLPHREANFEAFLMWQNTTSSAWGPGDGPSDDSLYPLHASASASTPVLAVETETKKSHLKRRECSLAQLFIAAQQRLASSWRLAGSSVRLHCAQALLRLCEEEPRGGTAEANAAGEEKRACASRKQSADLSKRWNCDTESSQEARERCEALRSPCGVCETPVGVDRCAGLFSSSSSDASSVSSSPSGHSAGSSAQLPSASVPRSSPLVSSSPWWLRVFRLKTLTAVTAALAHPATSLPADLQLKSFDLFRRCAALLEDWELKDQGRAPAGDVRPGFRSALLSELERQEGAWNPRTRGENDARTRRGEARGKRRAEDLVEDEMRETAVNGECGGKEEPADGAGGENCAVEFLDSSEEEQVAAETPYCMYTGGWRWSGESLRMLSDSDEEDEDRAEELGVTKTGHWRTDRVMPVLHVLVARMRERLKDLQPGGTIQDGREEEGEEEDQAEDDEDEGKDLPERHERREVERTRDRPRLKPLRVATPAEHLKPGPSQDMRQTVGGRPKRRRKRRPRRKGDKPDVEAEAEGANEECGGEKEEKMLGSSGEGEVSEVERSQGGDLRDAEETHVSSDVSMFFDLHVG